MMKALLGLAALLTLTACSVPARVKATPLRDQNAAQIQADGKRCEEWAKTTAVVVVGYAACMISAGYEATPEIGSTSERVRLAQTPGKNEPIGVLIDLLDCDARALREAESGLGLVRSTVLDTVGWVWGTGNKRRQFFVGCLKPRGYDIGKS